MIDNRNFKRIRKELKITWKDKSVSFSGITMDICQGGVFVVTSQAIPPKSVILVELWLDDEHSMCCRGEVVWLNRGEVTHYPPGFGIQFLDIDKMSLDRLLPCCPELEHGM